MNTPVNWMRLSEDASELVFFSIQSTDLEWFLYKQKMSQHHMFPMTKSRLKMNKINVQQVSISLSMHQKKKRERENKKEKNRLHDPMARRKEE